MILTKEDFAKCGIFAKMIVEKDNQYNRLNEPDKLRRFRTFLGKVGELYIHKYSHLLNMGSLEKFSYINEMFEIYEGANNVDGADFFSDHKKVDIKTIYAHNHKNIIIPVDQSIKDIYLGVKIHTKDKWFSTDFNKNCPCWEYNIVKMFKDITDFSCIGFIDRKTVEQQPIVKKYGNPAYFVSLDTLDTNVNNVHMLLSFLFPAEPQVRQKIKL